MAKEIFCTFGDRRRRGRRLDRLLWRGGFALRHPRGLFAGEVGIPRLLKLFDEYGLRPPGSSPATRSRPSPTRCRWSSTPGTRSALHGYSHENPIAMTPEQEEAVLVKCIDLIEKIRRQGPARLRRAVVGDVARRPRRCC